MAMEDSNAKLVPDPSSRAGHKPSV